MVYWRKGDLAQAVHCARTAPQKNRTVAQVYYNVGVLALQEAETPEAFSFTEAVSYIESAVRLDPDSLAPMYMLVWLRATAPEQAIREGKEALQFAEKVCRQTGYRDPSFLDTLGAAYAESWQFDVASEVARIAAELARTHGRFKLENGIRERVALYQTRTPYYNVTQEKFPR